MGSKRAPTRAAAAAPAPAPVYYNLLTQDVSAPEHFNLRTDFVASQASLRNIAAYIDTMRALDRVVLVHLDVTDNEPYLRFSSHPETILVTHD